MPATRPPAPPSPSGPLPRPAPARLLDLTGTVVAVTGAGGGIGAGIARRFAAAGASLLLHHRGDGTEVAALLDELVAAVPVATVRAELTAPDAPQQLVAAAVAAHGHLDVLVNNAGLQPVAALTDIDDRQWRELLEVNTTAVHRCTQAFAAHRRERGGGGVVVNVTSIEGVQPAPGHAHYATSKAALAMYTRAAALELGGHGLRVVGVAPGLIDRPGLAADWPEGVGRWQAAAPLGRLGSPEDVGDACVFLASPMAAWITGAELVVDGGVLARPTW